MDDCLNGFSAYQFILRITKYFSKSGINIYVLLIYHNVNSDQRLFHKVPELCFCLPKLLLNFLSGSDIAKNTQQPAVTHLLHAVLNFDNAAVLSFHPSFVEAKLTPRQEIKTNRMLFKLRFVQKLRDVHSY